jgi:OOP family OmpA-OmpF porin
MNRAILLGAIAAAAGLSSVALADDDTGGWYVNPMVQYWDLDSARNAKNNVAGQLGLGWNFQPNWAVELEGAAGKFKATNGQDLSLIRYSVDFLRKFMPESTVHPYVIFGGGGFQDHLPGYESTQTFGAEVGGGLLYDLGQKTGSSRWQARAEVKYQHEFTERTATSPDVGDFVVGVGIQYVFGIPAPVMAAAPPPPPPPVVMAPPPPPPPPVDGDDDHDGVPNSIDKCPNTPRGDKVDEYGCTIPDEIKLEGVNFATASSDLIPESDYVLQRAVRTLKKYPEFVVEVDGYTDNRGTPKYNLGLSQRRAESVEKYLKDHGVTNKITARGFGEANPIASNKTKDGQLENRRVTLKIVSGLH